MMYDFAERVAFSQGVDCHYGIQQHLLKSIPGAERMVRAQRNDDRNGIDYWINRRNGKPIGVDFKHRSFDPIERYGEDDICIETCSVYRGPRQRPYQDEHRQVIGWTLNEQKRTDLIVYTWPRENEHRRFWVVFFPHLCAVSQLHAENWMAQYGERPTPNRGYLTLNIFVPRAVVTEEIRSLTEGIANA